MFKTVDRKNTQSIKWDQVKRDDCLPFTVADSEYESPKPIIDALNLRVNHGVFGYTYFDDTYYQIIINYVKRHYGYSINPSEIITTMGVVGSLFYAIKMLDAKSEGVIIQTPVYNMFHGLIEKTNKKVIENKLIEEEGYYKMDFDHLEGLFAQGYKIMILCNPHNPVGRVYRDEELKRLVLLAKKYDVYLLSDEIHADIILNDNKFISLMNYYPLYEKMMVFISPSKSFNIAGLHISLVISKNDYLMETYRKITEDNFFKNPSLLSITALKAAYKDCDDWLIAQNKHLTNNYRIIQDYFKKHHPQAILSKVEGTYLLWINLQYLNVSCEEVSKAFIEHHILMAKGTVYSPDSEGYFRLNFACSTEQLLEGLHRLSQTIQLLEK